MATSPILDCFEYSFSNPVPEIWHFFFFNLLALFLLMEFMAVIRLSRSRSSQWSQWQVKWVRAPWWESRSMFPLWRSPAWTSIRRRCFCFCTSFISSCRLARSMCFCSFPCTNTCCWWAKPVFTAELIAALDPTSAWWGDHGEAHVHLHPHHLVFYGHPLLLGFFHALYPSLPVKRAFKC